MADNINPDHYKRLPAEAIEIIESAIDKAPSKQAAYLHGQVLKYILRCWNKNGIEDLRKAKWYLDRLIESFEANETEQPKVTGEFTEESEVEWVDAVWPQDWEKPARFWPNPISQNEGTPDHKLWDIGTVAGYVADGYRKWIIEMDGKISCQMYCQVKKNDGTLEQATQPPDGWRFLEVGEVIRKGDQGFEKSLFHAIEPMKIGMTLQSHWMPIVRRNRFEVGEKVVENIKQRICVVKEKIGGDENPREYKVEMLDTKRDRYFFPYQLAPYIEDAK